MVYSRLLGSGISSLMKLSPLMVLRIIDQCMYMKVSWSKYIFLVLYVDDILLVTNDNDLLVETKQLLFIHFDMKDHGEASYVLGIQILRDRPSGIMRLS